MIGEDGERFELVRGNSPAEQETDPASGWLIDLYSGDRVPADFEILVAQELEIDESMLTGESMPVLKPAGPSPDLSPTALRCYAGTLSKRGRTTGRVVATGERTEIGRIAHQVVDQDEVKPPLRAH